MTVHELLVFSRVSGKEKVVMSDLGDLQETVSDTPKEQDGATHNPATSLDIEASSSATQGYVGLQ